MKKLAFFVILCFGLSGCLISNRVTIDAVNNRLDDKTKVMNPYEYYNLGEIGRIVIQMEKSVEIGSDNTIEVPLKKVLIDKEDQKAILAEFNKETEYVNDFCLCTGNGDLYITLTDGTELKFRLKHGGSVLEERFDSSNDSRMFFPHAEFVKVIRKYYPEKLREYYKIEDRRQCGEISEEQRELEWLEFMRKYYPGDYFANLIDDPVIKDEYYKKTIIGSWIIFHEDMENHFSVDTYISDGEAWNAGEIVVSNQKIPCTTRSQWKIEDGYLSLIVNSSDYEDFIPVGKKTKNKILFMSDKFMSFPGKDDTEIVYMKVD